MNVETELILQIKISQDQDLRTQVQPVLHLRPLVPTELIKAHQKIKQPDGPWIAHTCLTNEEVEIEGNYVPDITLKDYREIWRGGVIRRTIGPGKK